MGPPDQLSTTECPPSLGQVPQVPELGAPSLQCSELCRETWLGFWVAPGCQYRGQRHMGQAFPQDTEGTP